MAKVQYIKPEEIPGTAAGAETKTEYRNRVLRGLALAGEGVVSRLRKAGGVAKSSFSGTSNKNEETKIASRSSGVSYLAGGALTIDRTNNKLVLAESTTEAKDPIFKTSKQGPFYSLAHTTILGSTDIQTVGEELMNPIATAVPSSHFSPVRTWVKGLFPSLSIENLLTMTIVEAIIAALAVAVSALRDDPSMLSEAASGPTIRAANIDMGTIIIDNFEIEKKILSRTLRTS